LLHSISAIESMNVRVFEENGLRRVSSESAGTNTRYIRRDFLTDPPPANGGGFCFSTPGAGLVE